MAQDDFSISVTPDAVDIRFTPSLTQPRGKLFGFNFTVLVTIGLGCALFFSPGKHGQPSMWHDIATAPPGSAGAYGPLLFLLIFVGLFGWQSFRYARAAWAADEDVHCDRRVLVLTRRPWLDFKNRSWRTQSYPLAEVHNLRFAVIASAKGKQYWGLRFRARGRRWMLPGLEAPEAKNILSGLRALGVDAPEDPKLEKLIKQTLEMRFGDTSWMDRSWMDANSNTDHKD